MSNKVKGNKRPAKVMETLSNAASLFQVPNMNVLATNVGVPVNADILMRNGQNGSPSKVRGRSVPSTVMCPW